MRYFVYSIKYTESNIWNFLDYSGAGHGGEGGSIGINASLADAFDHFQEPSLPGKGGRLTAGGGVLKITATKLTHKGAFNARYVLVITVNPSVLNIFMVLVLVFATYSNDLPHVIDRYYY